MGRRTTVRHTDKQGAVSNASPVNRGLRRIVCRPLTLLYVVWILSLVSAGVAVFTLVTIDPSEHPSPDVVADRLQPQPSQSSQLPKHRDADAIPEGNLPLFSLGVAALGCALGSMLISHRIKQHSTPMIGSTARSPQHSRTYLSPPQVMQVNRPGVSAAPPFVHQSTPLAQRRKTSQSSDQHSATVPVTPATPVPAEDSHPLDWDEPSLADHLDLRQKRPLSYWL